MLLVHRVRGHKAAADTGHTADHRSHDGYIECPEHMLIIQHSPEVIQGNISGKYGNASLGHLPAVTERFRHNIQIRVECRDDAEAEEHGIEC